MNKYIDPRANTYSLFEFQSKYGTEQDCEQALFRLKWPDGFVCPKCGERHFTIIHGRRLPLYQCPACRHQTSAITGTIMENTKLPLVKWFLALYFVAANKDGISAMALTKYIDTTLKTAWILLHKIRSAMGERENIYYLGGSVEMDEAFFGGKAAGKRGRGSENKAEVAVALQLDAIGRPQLLKMQVIPDAKGETLLAFAERNIMEGSTIHSDAFRSYGALSKKYCCDMQKYEPKSKDERLKWLHVMISNIKANIEGAYHGLGKKYLQRYLDEFCYRFNRRHSRKPVFDHLLECSVWSPYKTVAELGI